MKENNITIFICEDDDTSRKIIGEYLVPGKVTYAEFMPRENREKIVGFLKEIEESFLKLS